MSTTANGSQAERQVARLQQSRHHAPARPPTQQHMVVALVAEGRQIRQVRRNHGDITCVGRVVVADARPEVVGSVGRPGAVAAGVRVDPLAVVLADVLVDRGCLAVPAIGSRADAMQPECTMAHFPGPACPAPSWMLASSQRRRGTTVVFASQITRHACRMHRPLHGTFPGPWKTRGRSAYP